MQYYPHYKLFVLWIPTKLCKIIIDHRKENDIVNAMVPIQHRFKNSICAFCYNRLARQLHVKKCMFTYSSRDISSNCKQLRLLSKLSSRLPLQVKWNPTLCFINALCDTNEAQNKSNPIKLCTNRPQP